MLCFWTYAAQGRKRNVRAIARVSKESRKCSGLSSFLGLPTLLASSSSSCFVLLQYCPAFGSCSCVPAVGGNQLRRLVGSAVRSSTVCKLGSWVLAYRLGVGVGGGGRENLTKGSQCFVLYLNHLKVEELAPTWPRLTGGDPDTGCPPGATKACGGACMQQVQLCSRCNAGRQGECNSCMHACPRTSLASRLAVMLSSLRHCGHCSSAP